MTWVHRFHAKAFVSVRRPGSVGLIWSCSVWQNTCVCAHVETTGQHWVFSPVALLPTLVIETCFLTKPGVYQSARWRGEQSLGVILPLAAQVGDYRYTLLVFALGDEIQTHVYKMRALWLSCLFRSCILWRSNITIPWVHTLPSRKKYSELVGGSEEYGQEEKKSISLVKGLLSCSSRVPSGWKSPQSYLHICSLGGDLPSCTFKYNFPSACCW